MARRNDDGGGHPFFWLLLGVLCGVVGTLGALLLLSNDVTAPELAIPGSDAIGDVPLAGASPPETVAPPPVAAPQNAPPVTPRRPVEVPPPAALDHPNPPVFASPTPVGPPKPPAPRPAPSPASPAVKRPATPAPAQSRGQIDEDAAASGLTSRTR